MVSFTSQISLVFLCMLSATALNKIARSKNGAVRCNEKDRSTLMIFKKGVVDLSNRLASWSTEEEDCCSWAGIQCDNVTGRVTKLDLHIDHAYNYDTLEEETFLRGEINLSLLQLEFLNYLDLSNNLFDLVSIPPPANFSDLRYLDLSLNYLVMDNLDWLSRLPSLEYLDLSNIYLENETDWLISMASLASLSELRLRSCRLRNVSSSLNFVNFTSLAILDLSYNEFFKSKFPIWLFNLSRRISSVDLSGNQFEGEIPIAFLKLQNLKSLNLNHNRLNGTIPDWLGQLEHLEYVSLSENFFNGSVPSTLGNLSSLISLDLSYNNLSGDVPKSLGQLFNLESLRVGGNSLVGVLSELNFAKLSNLDTLELDSHLAFDLDSKWVPPFQLRYLSLRNTRLGPSFPTWLYTQRSLEYLDVSSSGISFIDHDEDMFWGFVGRINEVNLSHNSISGDLSNITLNSSVINLDYNNFRGGLPRISSNVMELSASHNPFLGSVFPLLCHRESGEGNMLAYLDLSNNLLSGALPDCWGKWKQLAVLYMGSNKLTGEIPASMGTLSNLNRLDLHNNNFFGEFSLDLSKWRDMELINLENNKFSGSLPSTMPVDLFRMNLRSNQFTGNIPLQICNLRSLMILDLAENMLSGVIPRCIYNITAMASRPIHSIPQETINVTAKGQEREYKDDWLVKSIDLSSNNLIGEIPPELFSLSGLYSLNLSRNDLSGKIPRQIGDMKDLESLDLSHNKLSGEIPETISGLSFLAYLNLSYNNFTGQIPVGTQIQSFEAWSFVGNPQLCGAPLPPNKCGKQKEYDDPNVAEERNEEDDPFLKSLYLGMGLGFAVGFWGVCGSLFFIRAWRHRFFRIYYGVVDQVYVAVALKFKSFE